MPIVYSVLQFLQSFLTYIYTYIFIPNKNKIKEKEKDKNSGVINESAFLVNYSEISVALKEFVDNVIIIIIFITIILCYYFYNYRDLFFSLIQILLRIFFLKENVIIMLIVK
jgi:hypothetical protein